MAPNVIGWQPEKSRYRQNVSKLLAGGQDYTVYDSG